MKLHSIALVIIIGVIAVKAYHSRPFPNNDDDDDEAHIHGRMNMQGYNPSSSENSGYGQADGSNSNYYEQQGGGAEGGTAVHETIHNSVQGGFDAKGHRVNGASHVFGRVANDIDQDDRDNVTHDIGHTGGLLHWRGKTKSHGGENDNPPGNTVRTGGHRDFGNEAKPGGVHDLGEYGGQEAKFGFPPFIGQALPTGDGYRDGGIFERHGAASIGVPSGIDKAEPTGSPSNFENQPSGSPSEFRNELTDSHEEENGSHRDKAYAGQTAHSDIFVSGPNKGGVHDAINSGGYGTMDTIPYFERHSRTAFSVPDVRRVDGFNGTGTFGRQSATYTFPQAERYGGVKGGLNAFVNDGSLGGYYRANPVGKNGKIDVSEDGNGVPQSIIKGGKKDGNFDIGHGGVKDGDVGDMPVGQGSIQSVPNDGEVTGLTHEGKGVPAEGD